MPEVKDEVRLRDEVKVAHTVGAVLGQVHYARVRVIAESGIFKNGKQYDQGDEAVITLTAAQGFESVGEVEIIERDLTEGQV